MSPYFSDQMFQRSQVSRVALCMSKVKVPWVSESVSEWQGHLLSCCGQLNTDISAPEIYFPRIFDEVGYLKEFTFAAGSREYWVITQSIWNWYIFNAPNCTTTLLKFTNSITIQYTNTRSLGARWARLLVGGPLGRLWILRGCLTSSFAPFGPSGRVTHATMH